MTPAPAAITIGTTLAGKPLSIPLDIANPHTASDRAGSVPAETLNGHGVR